MSDVLTKEEMALLAEHRGFNAVPSSDFVRTIDRLVAEVERLQDELLATVGRHADVVKQVERLRARNEALEKVAKHVALVAHFGGLINLSADGALNIVRRLTIGHFDKSSPPEELRIALSALNPSETPNSSGGET